MSANEAFEVLVLYRKTISCQKFHIATYATFGLEPLQKPSFCDYVIA